MTETISNSNGSRPSSSTAVADNPGARRPPSYVLMTAAHNEEADIERTIQSVVAQTVLPMRWLIVSDNSTDRTDEIIQKYADQYDFIRFFKRTRPPGRNFASKVVALRSGAHLLQDVSYDFIGNMDADLSVSPTYFEELLAHFEHNPRLAIAGGFVHEKVNGVFESRGANRRSSVAHAAQLVRRDCYEDFGGYAVLPYGGEDWHAQTWVRMRGWEAESFPELPINHYRPTGAVGGRLNADWRLGKLDYSFGTYTFFEFVKCVLRARSLMGFIGGIVRMAGFLDSWVRREPYLIQPELVAYLRREQKGRMLKYLRVIGIRSKDATAGESALPD